MRQLLTILLISTFALSSLCKESLNQIEVTLAADDWCPFTCLENNKQGPGLIPEIVENSLKKSEFKMKYEVMNWARALSMANKNEIVGVMGAFKSDVPNFNFPNKPQTISKNCFYGFEKNKMNFKNIESLKSKKIGIINSYSYDKLIDDFKVTSEGKQIFFESSGDDPLVRNVKKVEANHLDALLEDENVIQFKKINDPNFKNLINYGCLENKEIYAAFNPLNKNSSKLADLVSKYMNSKQGKIETKKILKKYLN